jgi:hypothetical protein
MLINKLALLRFVIGFFALVLCQACNPYAKRRLPLGNQPYMNCKNCNGGKTKKPAVKQLDDDDYQFTSAAHQKTIQPLPIQAEAQPKKRLKITKASNVRRRAAPVYVKSVKKKSVPAYGVVTEQDLIVNTEKPNPAALPTKPNNYVPLTEIPDKQYPPEKQKEMLLDKKAAMQDLSDRANQVKVPTTATPTLETEQMPAAPSKAGEMKLNDKLQELQKMVKESTPVAPQQEAPAPVPSPIQVPAQSPTQAPTPAPTPIPAQPEVQPQPEVSIQPFIPQKEATAPIAPAPAPAPTQPEVQPQQPATAKPDKDASSSSYDIESKPIPLPY